MRPRLALHVSFAVLASMALLPATVQAAKKRSGPIRPAPRAQAIAAQAEEEATDQAWPPLSGPQPCPHRVLFRNDAGVAVQLQVGPQPRRVVAKDRTLAVCVVADTLDWDVLAPAGWRYGGIAPLAGLRTRTIVLTAPGGTLEVVNQSGDGQRLRLDDRDLGVLPPGGLRRLGPLPPGPHRLLAQGQHGRELRPLQIEVRTGQTTVQTLAPASTVALLRNPLAEAVGVRIDGVDWGRLAARGAWRVLGLPSGRHEARLTGQDSGVQLTVPMRAAATEEASGEATVAWRLHNRTGEVLEVPAALVDQMGATIAPGAELEVRLPRGRYGVTLRGRDSGLAYHRDLPRGPAGAPVQWHIERPTAQLRVVNRTAEAAVVAVGADAGVPLAAGDQRNLVVPAGRLAVVADCLDGTRRLHAGLDLRPGRSASWIVQAPLTAVVVRNDDREPMLLRLDGQPRGELAAGRERRFEMSAGRHTLLVRGKHSGLRAEGEVQVRDGDLTTVAFWPPDAAVRVNADRLPLLVSARAVTLGTVAPGDAASLPVMPGRLAVEVQEGDRSEVWRGSLAPTQQAQVARPALSGVTLEAAWQGAADSAEVWMDDGPAQALGAARLARWAMVTPGAHVLTIRVAGREYRRRVFVDGHAPVRRLLLKQANAG
jgi:hypothetical protein